MFSIAPDFTSLKQYKQHIIQHGAKVLRPTRCPHCGKSGMRCHGSYPRKADRENYGEGSLNPLAIFRFLCPNCKKTCSVLPECIPPRRWYLWIKQQGVLALIILERSIRHIATQVIPGKTTISRWANRFHEIYTLHTLHLCSRYPVLGIAAGSFNTFWKAALEWMSLSQAMFWVHRAGENIP